MKDKGKEAQAHYQISDVTYADDVNILAGVQRACRTSEDKQKSSARTQPRAA